MLLGYAAVMFKEEYDDDDEFDLVAYFDVVLEDSMQFPPAFIWQLIARRAYQIIKLP